MAKYGIGDKVIEIVSERHGTIIGVPNSNRRGQLYKVTWDTGISGDAFEINLKPDCDISDPFERCISGIFDSYSEYAKTNTTFKIRSSNNSTISSLKASKTLFRAYQFKPLLKFLNSPNRRLLIADEVGLGKTIEAGHIMLELKARRELQHVLIVCPKSLQEKWKNELLFKFGLSFKIYEKSKDLIDDMQDSRVPIHAIINYEKIRKPKENKEEENKKTKSSKSNSLIEYLTDNEFRFSLVLCDEAHKLRNQKQNQKYGGAEIIMSHADAAVFLTATPVMISTENLYNLLHLLDNTRYHNYQIFDNLLQENRPFIEAISALNHNVSFKEISKTLNESEISTRYTNSNNLEIFSNLSTVGKVFEQDVMYQEIIKVLHGDDNYRNRARLQYLLSSMSVMNSVFSRTRKREVTTDLSQAERKPHLCKIELSAIEREAFDKVINQYKDDNSYTDIWGDEYLPQGIALGLVQKKRQIASSVFAYLNSEENLNIGIDKYADYSDSKFNELIKIIEEVFKHGTKKIVIFSIFRKTLKYLQIRFNKYEYGTLVLHGSVQNRSEILDEFKNNPNVHILLSSEVGSEGLDMQFCNSMVNYDLPWNPMVVEQRIGRIDRFGQKSPTVNIYNFVVANSIQEDIYVRLLERIGIFQGTIGDMEAILDTFIEHDGEKITIQDAYNKLEKELFTSNLTKEERQRKINDVERAIANEKENIKHLEKELDNSFTNDAYFKDEIRRIQESNAYVTEVELINYLETVIRQELSTCSLVQVEDKVYEFKLPLSNQRVLQNFLTRYQPADDESNSIFKRFKYDIENQTTIRLTFNQQVAYDNNKLIFVNIYHPIIQACLQYFENKKDKTKTSFSYALREDNLLKAGASFYLIVYKLITCRKVWGIKKYSETLLPILYDIKGKSVVHDENLVNRIFSKSQSEGIEQNANNEDIESDMIEDMRYDFAVAINEEKTIRREEIELQAKSEQQRNSHQIIEYYDSQIRSDRQRINHWQFEIEISSDDKRKKELEGVIRFAEGRISTFEKEKEERLAKINEDPELDIHEEILTLNLIKII